MAIRPVDSIGKYKKIHAGIIVGPVLLPPAPSKKGKT
jgi:hypothetical protein